MDLHPPPVGFKYVIDAAGRVVLDQATGKPKVIPIDSASPGPSPLADTNKLAPPSESIGATATLVPPRPTTPKSVAGSDTNKLAPPSQSIGATATLVPPRPTTPKSVAESETTRSDTKSTRSDAKSKKVEIFDFVPEAAKQIKNSTKQTFDGVTDFANNIVDDPGDAAQDALRGMSTFVQDFFKFISRGNVIDLAVGIIVGNAFTAIVTSLTNDMISPIIGLIGNKDLSAYNTVMRSGLSGNSSYPTPAQAKADAAITLAWGAFLNSIVNFLIISFAVFNMIKFIGLFYRKKQTVTITCFWCKEAIIDGARRCGKCGSTVPTKEQELIICEMEKQAGETLESMVDSADMDKVAVKTQLLQNTNVVMTGVGATVPISPQPPSRDDRFV